MGMTAGILIMLALIGAALALGAFVYIMDSPSEKRVARRKKFAMPAAYSFVLAVIFMTAGIGIKQYQTGEAVAAGGFASAKDMWAAKDAGYSTALLEAQAGAAARAEAERVAMAKAVAATRAKKARAEAAVKAEAEACKTNLRCLAEKHLASADVRCRPLIEAMAKYDFEWTDGWLESKFDRYKWYDGRNGHILFIGKKIKLQNGFGAWSHMTYVCRFDTNSERAVEVAMLE